MKLLTLALCSLLFVSCASNDKKEETNPFNPLTLKEKIVEGKTSQAEVLDAFGAPDITTETESKEDVWTYAKTTTKKEGSSAGIGALAIFFPGPLLGVGGDLEKHEDETATKSVSVTIRFNKKKIVKSYTISKTKV